MTSLATFVTNRRFLVWATLSEKHSLSIEGHGVNSLERFQTTFILLGESDENPP